MISVLFARKDSIYKTLGVDVWDIERDARKWSGCNAVVAHPPCRAWGKLKHFARPRPDEKELAVYAVGMIRIYGGVLEHPCHSSLWPHMGLPTGQDRDIWGGFSILVNQFWWGHKAEKKTLLYIVGCDPVNLPPIPISFDAVQYVVARSKKRQARRIGKEVTKPEREATPPAFAKWLIDVAELCDKKKNQCQDL